MVMKQAPEWNADKRLNRRRNAENSLGGGEKKGNLKTKHKKERKTTIMHFMFFLVRVLLEGTLRGGGGGVAKGHCESQSREKKIPQQREEETLSMKPSKKPNTPHSRGGR